ncbi:MAG TPA: Crp/Fnr family transcriptional regulator [Bacteroidales bacterium]|nr:Crp/Fnr family transcriptional regulator [Bacteroidales bacterium]
MNSTLCHQCYSGCPFYLCIKDTGQGLLLNEVSEIFYKRKELIFKQNTRSTQIFYLKSGLVKLSIERRNEKNAILKILTPGSFIGINSFSKDLCQYSAAALTNSEVCIIPKEVVFKLITSNPCFAQIIFDAISEKYAYIIRKISSLSTKQMHGRLADVLLYLNSSEFNNTDVFSHITRQDIAELSGMALESVIRLLSEFKEDGLIRLDGKKIVINNEELILKLSEIG